MIKHIAWLCACIASLVAGITLFPKTVEVTKEVPVTKEVIKEVPVTKEVIKEVPVTKEVPVIKEVIKEVPAPETEESLLAKSLYKSFNNPVPIPDGYYLSKIKEVNPDVFIGIKGINTLAPNIKEQILTTLKTELMRNGIKINPKARAILFLTLTGLHDKDTELTSFNYRIALIDLFKVTSPDDINNSFSYEYVQLYQNHGNAYAGSRKIEDIMPKAAKQLIDDFSLNYLTAKQKFSK